MNLCLAFLLLVALACLGAVQPPLRSNFSYKALTLNAGQTRKIDVTGTYFIITDSDAITHADGTMDLFMKFSETDEEFPIRLGFGFRLVAGDHFERLWFTNTGAAAITFSFFAAFGEITDARLNLERTNQSTTTITGWPAAQMDSRTWVLPAGFTLLAAGTQGLLAGTANQTPPWQRKYAVVSNEHATDTLQVLDQFGTPFQDVAAGRTEKIWTADPLLITVPGANSINLHAGEIFYYGTLGPPGFIGAAGWPTAIPEHFYLLNAIKSDSVVDNPYVLDPITLAANYGGGTITQIAGPLAGNSFALSFNTTNATATVYLYATNLTETFPEGITMRMWVQSLTGTGPGSAFGIASFMSANGLFNPSFQLCVGPRSGYTTNLAWVKYTNDANVDFIVNSLPSVASPWADTVWHCIYVWFDPTGIQPLLGIQVDNNPAATNSWSFPFDLTFTDFRTGCNGVIGPNTGWNMAGLCVWKGVLNRTGRLLDYNNGSGMIFTKS